LKKIPKRVWYSGAWFDVVRHISLHAEEDYLVIASPTECVHFDGAYANEMYMIDCHNDVWMPDTGPGREAAWLAEEADIAQERARKEINAVWLAAALGEEYP
jgi:hypothetical protein